MSISPLAVDGMITNESSYWQIYRPDCQRLLADGARRAGASIEYGREVLKVDAEQGAVFLVGGKVLVADLVVGADGTDPFSKLGHRSLISRKVYDRRREHVLPVTKTQSLSRWQSTTIAR